MFLGKPIQSPMFSPILGVNSPIVGSKCTQCLEVIHPFLEVIHPFLKIVHQHFGRNSPTFWEEFTNLLGGIHQVLKIIRKFLGGIHQVWGVIHPFSRRSFGGFSTGEVRQTNLTSGLTTEFAGRRGAGGRTRGRGGGGGLEHGDVHSHEGFDEDFWTIYGNFMVIYRDNG